MRSRWILAALGLAGLSRATDARADEPVRPPPFTDELPAPKHEKVRRLSLTASVVTLSMPANSTIESTDGTETTSQVDYAPTVGVDVAMRFPIFRYLEAGVGATFAMPTVAYDHDALGLDGYYDGGALARVQGEIRLYPTLPLTDRVTLFAIVGAGFGRLEFPAVEVEAPRLGTTTIAARGASFFDFPIGVGATFALVPKWLSLELSLDVAPMLLKDGDAFVPVQAIERGKKVHASALPKIDATYRQTLGLSLLL